VPGATTTAEDLIADFQYVPLVALEFVALLGCRQRFRHVSR
jgi:hypothetical protein